MNRPPIVSESEWQAAHEELLAREKEATRARDALAAERRRQPMYRIEKDYVFEGPGGNASLLDLFEGRRQLIVYHFMFGPNQEAGCGGCSMFVDQVGDLAHLHARDTSFVLISRAPVEKLEHYRKRMGWTIPWYSSFDSDFNVDFGRSPRSRSPTSIRTERASALASSSATMTMSFVRISRGCAAWRRSAAPGRSST